MGWVAVGTFDTMDEDALAEVQRWQDVAYDVGFHPERVVKVERIEEKVRVLIDQDLYDYFRRGV
ncbi:MAG: hypothetical protein ACLFTB_05600 [Desulfovibrionales bacterium]